MMNQDGGATSAGHDHGTVSVSDQEGGSESGTEMDHGTMTGTGIKTSVSTGHEEFRVEGLCEMCKERIETAARSVHGVEAAEWNMESKILHISFDESHTEIDDVKKAIAEAGHDNDKYRAPDSTYNNLPDCCLYRK
jgi:Cu(I)/Ag(I) efflux system membrane fusion protein